MKYPYSFFNMKVLFCFMFFIISVVSCKKENEKIVVEIPEDMHLFKSIPSSISKLDFVNTLEETIESNYYQYMYTYIGGGVAAGDLNNDGLVDLYFTSNSSQDKLYLNQGNLSFKDVTSQAGIKHLDGFNTGVTMADVNNDGFLDIYISRGGWQDEDNKFANLLYINNGDMTFTEKASELGLADANRTIQATFFDYDNDNDLDVYISNTPDITSRTEVLDLDKIQKDPKTLELKGSDKLYNNDGTGHFTDVSVKAGLIYDIGFGLNPQVGDLNNDGWLDVYVCNDFNSPDLAYLNNGDGTFTESRDTLFKHMSFNSMGSDFADVNNDGYLDLMTLDMNPEDYVRSKTTMGMTSIPQFELMVEKGYHHQYMHNMLQMNNANGTFSEISKMAGIGDTDWSWSILSADFDLDGFNDIFVTNGVYRDVIDQDKNNEILQILRENGRKPIDEDFLKFAKMLPQQKLNNYFFKNNGDLTFEKVTEKWSDLTPSFSNGAVYADLDNDGDLDIVVNNINDEATLLQNTAADNKQNNYLKIDFVGADKNKFGIGTIANLYFKDGSMQTRQVINTRGFLSSVPNTLCFGLNKNQSVEKLEVIWSDGKIQELKDVNANQLLVINYDQSKDKLVEDNNQKSKLFVKVDSNFKHEDSYFNDYDLQVLLPHKLSQTGPALAKGDVNNDGLDDIFVGGGMRQSAELLLGTANGAFKPIIIQDFKNDKNYEDQGACFFDADNDGDQDLYVVSGSYEFAIGSLMLQDRLYLNDGTGQFSKSKNALPEFLSSGSIVRASDFDNDGDLDLFIGGRVIPGKYPFPPTSALLINDKGIFTNATKTLAPDLEQIGMVTDAIWADINNDQKLDLVVTGEWMGVEIFINENNKLVKSDAYSNVSSAVGWWNKLLVEDIDNDGDLDIVAGNLGLNYKFHASEEKPFHVYTNDFDYNGTQDIFLAKYYNDKQVPVRGKGCSTQQMPVLKNKIQTYQDFANLDLEGIVGPSIKTALHYKATEFRSGLFINNGKDGFVFSPFENQLQTFPINSMLFEDLDNDGHKDLLLAGNNYQSEVETTRADAGKGAFLKGNSKGMFKYVSHLESGFFVDKDVRDMVSLDKNKRLFVINNNDRHNIFNVNNN